jgi:mercuric ion transport protein
MKTTYISTGLITAIASSLCCIAPLIAIFGGVAGTASAFSWIEPARPFLIGASIIALALAFYQACKTKPADDCTCEVPEKKNFLNSKGFLWSITILSMLMFSFPYYSNNFYSQTAIVQTESDRTKTVQCTIGIEGMTCAGCENHVQSALLPMNGVSEAKASYKEGNAIIQVDTSKISISVLKMKLAEKTGYKVLEHKIGK